MCICQDRGGIVSIIYLVDIIRDASKLATEDVSRGIDDIDRGNFITQSLKLYEPSRLAVENTKDIGRGSEGISGGSKGISRGIEDKGRGSITLSLKLYECLLCGYELSIIYKPLYAPSQLYN